MFLKTLRISLGDGTVIRDIRFRQGLNLIVDETPIAGGKETGNNVGKTTTLKLVDFCLGANAKGIYSDQENHRNEYKLVRDFLVEKRVLVSLVLKEALTDDESREVLIERNFLPRRQRIQRIDGRDLTEDEFDRELMDLLFPGHYGRKPTFRQIIAHNIRYKDVSINNTLKNLDRFTRDDEYETLYLFLFGCDFEKGDDKQDLRTQIEAEEKFKHRLESEQTRAGYEAALDVLQSEIDDLERRRASLDTNPDLEGDLERLNGARYRINALSAELGRLELRRNLIIEAQQEIRSEASNIDLQQLQLIYQQATSLVSGIQKTFEELYEFHNRMVESRGRFVAQDLPRIEARIAEQREQLSRLLNEESDLSAAVTRSDSFAILEELIVDLNVKHERKGQYESIVDQLSAVDDRLATLNARLMRIDDELFSDEFALRIKEQLGKFNRHFASVSSELYGEKYLLKVERKVVKGRPLYEFSAFNTNFSSGKKLGEISCFDIAYTLFADEEGIPCMHFLLNDKKELMHDNQLLMIGNLVNARGIQFVASILRDKLPAELNRDEYVVLRLSQDDKLFRIEQLANA